MKDMIIESINKGGNAILGIAYSQVTFANSNMIGVSVSGTSVIVGENREKDEC